MIRRALLLVAFTTALLAPATPATLAQKKPKAEARPESKGENDDSGFDLAAVRKQLESGKPAEILAALEAIEEAGEAAKDALPLLRALLERGASIAILPKALSATGATRQAPASEAIAPYVRHRVGDVRRAATRALVKSKGPAAVKALRAALRSKDAAVRGLAASGLGQLGAKEAMPDLLAALDHSVGEAAASIGQLCEGAGCDELSSRLGKVGFDVMSSGLDQILFRPASAIPDDQKVKLIARVRELGTGQAGKFLAEAAERWPKDWSQRVKQALDAAAKATGGRAGSEDE